MPGSFKPCSKASRPIRGRNSPSCRFSSEADSHQIEIDWNRTETRQLLGRNFVQLFEAQVERTPNAVAVLGGDSEFTYRELNERANQFARYFQSLDVGHDSLAGVCLPRAPETLAVLLGVWKAGGAFLPLDPDYPPDRIAFKLRDAGVSLLVTQTALLPKVDCRDSVAWEPTQAVCRKSSASMQSKRGSQVKARAISKLRPRPMRWLT